MFRTCLIISLMLCLPYVVLYQAPATGVPYTADSTSVYENAVASSVTIIAGPASGSGFVVADGLVATARHVVEGRQEIAIITSEGAWLPVLAVHLSPDTDIALLEFFGPHVGPVSFGDRPAIGDPVFAVGSPFGMTELRIYVTAGIVSVVGRTVEGHGVDMVFTDAAVNFGNSGGGLFDRYGRLIGMVVSQVAAGEGIGLCLPASQVQREMDRWNEREGL